MITSFPTFPLHCYRRFAVRIILSLLIFAAAVLTLSVGKQTSQPVFAQPFRAAAANLNLVVRDSMTEYAVPSEVSSNNKDRRQTFTTNADGRVNYPLSSGRNDLEI